MTCQQIVKPNRKYRNHSRQITFERWSQGNQWRCSAYIFRAL